MKQKQNANQIDSLRNAKVVSKEQICFLLKTQIRIN